MDSYTEIRDYCEARKVTLVAISKTKTAAEILEVYHKGQRHFGENKVQELLAKKGELPAAIQWHMVGHLQSNKIKQVLPVVHLIHSVDSWGLLVEINRQADKLQLHAALLLQIHVAMEETKFGFSFAEAKDALLHPGLPLLGNITICGFMAMASLTADEEQVRREFRQVKQFNEEMKSLSGLPANFQPDILSMGMSGDYRIAVEEGSTMVRIGTAIFGSRS